MASVINQIKFNNVEYAIAASAYGYCETAGGTQAKAVSLSTDSDTTNTAFTLIKGVSVTIKFKNTNSAASATLNVNGSGAKPIYYKGSAVPANYLREKRTYVFVYTTDVVSTGVWEVISDITTVVNSNPTLSWGTTSTVGSVDGANLQVTMPADPAYVTQTIRTTNGAFPILLRGESAGNTTVKATTSFDSDVTVNPSTGTLTTNSLVANGSIAAVSDISSESDIWAEGDLREGQGELPLRRKYASFIPAGTAVPANANLNTATYLKVGNYYCSADVNAATLTNCPTGGRAFMMQVYSPLATTIDNETTGTWVYRVRKILTYTGYEYQQCVSSGATAGTFTYGAWEAKPAATLSGTTLTLKI